MKYSAIILSGGKSKRFGEDKGLFMVFHKPLLAFIVKKIAAYTDEVIIVTSDKSKAKIYSSLFPLTQVLIDEYESGAAIFGAITGLKHAKGDYSFLLPSDTPLISKKVLALIRELSIDYTAVIPRWPSGYIEPLQAIYHTQLTYHAAMTSIQNGNLTLRNMISNLPNILYLSTLVLKQYDPQLRTFYNINRLEDLHKIRHLLRRPDY